MKACWNPVDIPYFIRTQALEGESAAFLAVHSPIRDFEVVKGEALQATDEALLKRLYDASPHVLAMVEGEPGSGKSHLIQWMKHRWPPNPADKVVLVPRSNGDMFGALQQLKTELGPEHAGPLTGLAEASKYTPEARERMFLGNLEVFCRSSAYEKGKCPPDAEWLDQVGFARLLTLESVREEWDGPRNIIRTILGNEGQRDQDLAIFQPADVRSLIECVRLGGPSVLSGPSLQFFRALSGELQQLQTGGGRAGGQALPPTSQAHRLLDALNRRRKDALHGALGVDAGDLKHRFMEMRRSLRRANQRLVLLLEDMTSMEGVDDQLLEALLPPPTIEANRDLCDLVGVIGLTPGYRAKALEGLGSIFDRIDIHVRLSAFFTISQGGTPGTLSLNSPKNRLRFIGTYLNAVRVGTDKIRRWGGTAPNDPRPCACSSCPNRTECFSAFGTTQIPKIGTEEGVEVGLFPFTAQAIDNFWLRLEDSTSRRLLRTPRGLLQNVVSSILKDAASVDEGTFPSKGIEGNCLRLDSPGPDLSDVSRRLGADEGKRLLRTVTYWGDVHDGKFNRTKSSYSGVPGPVAQALNMPWPGGLQVASSTEPPRPEVVPTQLAEVTRAPSLPEEAPHAIPQQPAPPVPSTVSSPKRVPEELVDLNRWATGEPLRNSRTWEKLLIDAILALPARALGHREELWKAIFTQENVSLAGSRGRHTRRSFELDRTPIAHRGLSALFQIRDASSRPTSNMEALLDDAVLFQSHLIGLTEAHFLTLVGDMEKTLGGPLAQRGAASLATTAILGSRDSTNANALQIWRAATTLERPPPRQCLSPQLNQLSKSLFDNRHDLFANVMSLLRVGVEGSKDGLIDGATAYRVSKRAWSDLGEWTSPKSTISFPPIIETLGLVVSRLGSELRSALRQEQYAAEALTKELSELLSGNDIEGIIPRLSRVIEQCLHIAPDLINVAVASRWGRAFSDLASAELTTTTARVRALDDALRALNETEPENNANSRLRTILGLDKSDLKLVHEAVVSGTRSIEDAHDRAAEWIRKAGAADNTHWRTKIASLLKTAGRELSNSKRRVPG